MNKRWVKGVATVVGAVFFSTLGIFASDALQGIDSQFASLNGSQKAGVCNEGSVPIRVGEALICVDIYEASPSDDCPNKEFSTLAHSEQNANTKNCYPATVAGKLPWNYISLPQAQRICASAGKRLPTSKEWYQYALGTSPESCIIQDTHASITGTNACVSANGVYDVVGNVWEWVDESVVGNTFAGRTLPEEGYVTSVDAEGVAITTAQDPDDLYGRDYIWTNTEGVFGMIRGGFYGSKNDAGLYTINATVATSFASQGVGFRCVKDVI